MLHQSKLHVVTARSPHAASHILAASVMSHDVLALPLFSRCRDNNLSKSWPHGRHLINFMTCILRQVECNSFDSNAPHDQGKCYVHLRLKVQFKQGLRTIGRIDDVERAAREVMQKDNYPCKTLVSNGTYTKVGVSSNCALLECAFVVQKHQSQRMQTVPPLLSCALAQGGCHPPQTC